MISVREASALVSKAVKNRIPDWIGSIAAGEPCEVTLSISLRPPTEAHVLADRAAAQEWARQWREAVLPAGVEVDWEERRWPRLSTQRVPVRVRLSSPEACEAFAGGEIAQESALLRARAHVIRDAFADGTVATNDQLKRVVRGARATLARLTDTDFDHVVTGARWLASRPRVALRPRQIPIRGVDSKWFGAHRQLLGALFEVATGAPLDIVEADARVRVRILGADVDTPWEMTDFAAPATQLARLPLKPRAVLLTENLECLLAFPAWDGVVAIHSSGYAVSQVGQLEWLTGVPVIYWGDLDSHGFAILSMARGLLAGVGQAGVVSVLMDEDTLMAHRDLWVQEPKPTPGTFAHLTEAEQRTLERIRSLGHVRLEQERIPWDTCVAELERALGAVLASKPALGTEAAPGP